MSLFSRNIASRLSWECLRANLEKNYRLIPSHYDECLIFIYYTDPVTEKDTSITLSDWFAPHSRVAVGSAMAYAITRGINKQVWSIAVCWNDGRRYTTNNFA